MGRDKIELGMAPPAVRGRARVQLFDAATGNETLNVQHENFVSERWLRAMAWFANWGAFSCGSVGVDTQLRAAPAFSQIPFAGIALTDYDGIPDQDERLIRGRPLAHGSKNVAGGGSWRGNYNTEESVHRFEYHKLVYDFATSQANGIFQSIYTGFFDSSGNNDQSAIIASRFAFNTSSTSAIIGGVWHVRDETTGDLYECTATTVSQILDWTPLAYGQAAITTVPVTLSPSAASISGFAIRAGRLFWITATASSARTIVSAPLTDLTNTRVEKTFNSAWAQSHGGGSNGGTFITGLAYHPVRDVFLISVGSSGTGRPLFAIMALDPVTFADGDKWGAAGDGAYTGLVAYPNELGIICDTTSTSTVKNRFVQLESDGTLTVSGTSACRAIPWGSAALGLASTSGGPHLWAPAPAQHFFSRALLDAPVEKTAQNTMKITYEFTFDEPVLP